MDDSETAHIPESAKIKLAELSNPMLDAALASLSNALEAFQNEGERHRQSALIQMRMSIQELKMLLIPVWSQIP